MAITQQLNDYLARLREATSASDSADTNKEPAASRGEQAARIEIAKRLETQIEPIKAAIEAYQQQIIGDDPQLKLARVQYLVGQGKNKEAAEVFQQHWQDARFDLLVRGFASLLTSETLDTADRDAIELLLMQAVQQAEGKPE